MGLGPPVCTDCKTIKMLKGPHWFCPRCGSDEHDVNLLELDSSERAVFVSNSERDENMKCIERDIRQGEMTIIDDFDISSGKLLDYEGKDVGMYTLVKVPQSEGQHKFVDANTGEPYMTDGIKFVAYRLHYGKTKWDRTEIWWPVDEIPNYRTNLFDDAMSFVRDMG